ncbi:MAG: NnrU family protein [Alphaproteobacteria bacterium]
MDFGFAAYLAAAAALVASHAVLSAPNVRPALIRGLGRPGFYAAYSALSFAALGAFVWTYAAVGSGFQLYQPLPGARLAVIALMPVAVFLVTGRITTPYGAPEAPRPAYGVYRICRFPGSVGLLLWAVLHLLNMGDARRTVLFATMALISVLALIKNQRLRRASARADGDADFADTRLVPFSAILAGRQRLVWREIGWRRLALTLAVYFALLFGHPYLIGVDPLAF